jgi:hypothetical protein
MTLASGQGLWRATSTGKNLPVARRKVLQRAKDELRKRFGRQ